MTGLYAIGVSLVVSLIGSVMYADAMAEMETEKLVSFGFMMDGFGQAMDAVQKLTPESVEAAGQVVELAQRYVEVQAEMKMASQDSFVQALKGALGLEGAGGGGGGKDVVLVLNDREFGRAVNVALEKKHNLNLD